MTLSSFGTWPLTLLPLPTHSLSQKQSLLLISATGSFLVDKRAAGLTSGARFLSQLTATSNFLDLRSADRTFTSSSSLSRPHQQLRVSHLCCPRGCGCQQCALIAGTHWQTLELSQDSGNPHFSPYTTSMKMSAFPVTI